MSALRGWFLQHGMTGLCGHGSRRGAATMFRVQAWHSSDFLPASCPGSSRIKRLGTIPYFMYAFSNGAGRIVTSLSAMYGTSRILLGGQGLTTAPAPHNELARTLDPQWIRG